jgi:hypothetical protein
MQGGTKDGQNFGVRFQSKSEGIDQYQNGNETCDRTTF